MIKNNAADNGIPISISLQSTLEDEDITKKPIVHKQRILMISLLSIFVAVCISFIAKFLVYLIGLVTAISFYGKVSSGLSSPAHNHLGIFVIFIPVIGGVIVGLMALYGSKAIRGHGIPEAMEQILTNQSKIKPAVTYLKPISSAIAIGTGGPFGAEGPIIATGGALGSTIGQLLKITHNERKILLAAGATAGMAAIFGSPIAGVFLAIELLFEFSPRSLIPVALACITGAAGHHFLFGSVPVFYTSHLAEPPSNKALFFYSILGIITGILSILVTKAVYFVEDLFEKLPVHWMWWPAIGGLFVGIIGYFSPETLGVGYDNITNLLTGSLPLKIVLSLCLLKFISWTVALSSGTSGGTLAPLLTIGGATGALSGMSILYLFPGSGVSVALAALTGMSAMFAGASRAFITSVIFALETTGQSNALLPILASCTSSYLISFFFMENTIMTEKIARRGVTTPDTYEQDIFEKITVGDIVRKNILTLHEEDEIGAIRKWLENEEENAAMYYIVVNRENVFSGIVSSSDLYHHKYDEKRAVGDIPRKAVPFIKIDVSLKTAIEMMGKAAVDVLPVISDKTIMGTVCYEDILSAYKMDGMAHSEPGVHINLKRNPSKGYKRLKKVMPR